MSNLTGGCFWAGVRAARLMTWQERLATLRDLGRWDHALLMGLTLLDAARVLQHPFIPIAQLGCRYHEAAGHGCTTVRLWHDLLLQSIFGALLSSVIRHQASTNPMRTLARVALAAEHNDDRETGKRLCCSLQPGTDLTHDAFHRRLQPAKPRHKCSCCGEDVWVGEGWIPRQ